MLIFWGTTAHNCTHCITGPRYLCVWVPLQSIFRIQFIFWLLFIHYYWWLLNSSWTWHQWSLHWSIPSFHWPQLSWTHITHIRRWLCWVFPSKFLHCKLTKKTEETWQQPENTQSGRGHTRPERSQTKKKTWRQRGHTCFYLRLLPRASGRSLLDWPHLYHIRSLTLTVIEIIEHLLSLVEKRNNNTSSSCAGRQMCTVELTLPKSFGLYRANRAWTRGCQRKVARLFLKSEKSEVIVFRPKLLTDRSDHIITRYHSSPF